MTAAAYITEIFSWFTLFADVVLVLFIICLIAKTPLTQSIVAWVGKYATAVAFLLALSGMIGSLLFSELLGFEPCVLCWVQRVFLYPQIIILGLALWWKDKSVIPYAFALSIIGGLIALYHSYTHLGGHSFTPCTSEGGACAKVFVLEFGYITIPMMALTLFALLIVTFIAQRRTSRLLS